MNLTSSAILNLVLPDRVNLLESKNASEQKFSKVEVIDGIVRFPNSLGWYCIVGWLVGYTRGSGNLTTDGTTLRY